MSDTKCPFCQQEMICGGTICHYNPDCPIHDKSVPTEVLDLLECTRKALDLALAELQEIDGACDDNKYTDNLYIGLDGQDTRNIALDVKKTITQIITLTKGGSNE